MSRLGFQPHQLPSEELFDKRKRLRYRPRICGVGSEVVNEPKVAQFQYGLCACKADVGFDSCQHCKRSTLIRVWRQECICASRKILQVLDSLTCPLESSAWCCQDFTWHLCSPKPFTYCRFSWWLQVPPVLKLSKNEERGMCIAALQPCNESMPSWKMDWSISSSVKITNSN